MQEALTKLQEAVEDMDLVITHEYAVVVGDTDEDITMPRMPKGMEVSKAGGCDGSPLRLP
jgi:hypothetical protein